MIVFFRYKLNKLTLLSMRLPYLSLPKWTDKKPLLPLLTSILSILASDVLYKFIENPNTYFKKWDFDQVISNDEWLRYYEIKDFDLLWFNEFFANLLEDKDVLRIIHVILGIFKRRIEPLKREPDIFRPLFSENDFYEFLESLYHYCPIKI